MSCTKDMYHLSSTSNRFVDSRISKYEKKLKDTDENVEDFICIK